MRDRIKSRISFRASGLRSFCRSACLRRASNGCRPAAASEVFLRARRCVRTTASVVDGCDRVVALLLLHHLLVA